MNNLFLEEANRMKTSMALALMVLGSNVAWAERVVKSSSHPVAVTVDRLAGAVGKAGAQVFARIDHCAGAAKVGIDIPANQMLMFGNPKLGTPAIVAAPSIGVDLPLRVSVYEDGAGKVWLTYHDPAGVAAAHGVPADHPVIKKMQGVLAKLTNVATQP
ncbi:MAG: hypothetical protein ACI9W2_003184 [Gammaproteobacteria bacterium]